MSEASRSRRAAELAIRLAEEGVIQDQIAERARAVLDDPAETSVQASGMDASDIVELRQVFDREDETSQLVREITTLRGELDDALEALKVATVDLDLDLDLPLTTQVALDRAERAEARAAALESAITAHRKGRKAYYDSIQALPRIEDIDLWSLLEPPNPQGS